MTELLKAAKNMSSSPRAMLWAKVLSGSSGLWTATLEQGNIKTSNGADSSSTSVVRSVGFVSLPAGKYTLDAEGADTATIYLYDEEETYINYLSSAALPRTFELTAARKLRATFRASGELTPEAVGKVSLTAVE